DLGVQTTGGCSAPRLEDLLPHGNVGLGSGEHVDERGAQGGRSPTRRPLGSRSCGHGSFERRDLMTGQAHSGIRRARERTHGRDASQARSGPLRSATTVFGWGLVRASQRARTALTTGPGSRGPRSYTPRVDTTAERSRDGVVAVATALAEQLAPISS